MNKTSSKNEINITIKIDELKTTHDIANALNEIIKALKLIEQYLNSMPEKRVVRKRKKTYSIQPEELPFTRDMREDEIREKLKEMGVRKLIKIARTLGISTSTAKSLRKKELIETIIRALKDVERFEMLASKNKK